VNEFLMDFIDFNTASASASDHGVGDAQTIYSFFHRSMTCSAPEVLQEVATAARIATHVCHSSGWDHLNLKIKL
jgi:hypothetical protein